MGADRVDRESLRPSRAVRADGPPSTSDHLVQRKLTVGRSDDPAEAEADRVAVAVMSALRTTAPRVDTGAEDDDRERRVQRMPPLSTDDAGVVDDVSQPSVRDIRRSTIGRTTSTGAVSAGISRIQRRANSVDDVDIDTDVNDRIQRARRSGSPLAATVRRRMESGFGADFSSVRVHDNAEADDLNRRVQARAFTTGSDVFFSAGAYQPSTPQGEQLLAHELTHTIQQGAAPTDGGAVRRSHDPQVVQRLTVFGKRLFGKPKVGKPKSGHAMTPAEHGTAMSAREVIEATDQEREQRQLLARNWTLNQHLPPEQLAELERNPDALIGPEQAEENPELAPDHQGMIALPVGTSLQPVHDDFSDSGAAFALQAEFHAKRIDEVTDGPLTYDLFEADGQKYMVLQGDVGAESGWKGLDGDDVDPMARLFPTEPSRADIQQGSLGDCYLEAALAALVTTDPASIKKMLLDHGERVSVTLFDIVQNPPADETFKKRVVVVEKSVAKDSSGGRLYDQGALWVSMVEKAYAVAKYAGDTGTETAIAGTRAGMGDIAQGSSAHALMHLTGRPATHVLIGKAKGRQQDHADIPWNRQAFDKWKTESAEDDPDYMDLLAFKLLTAPKSGPRGFVQATNMTDGFFSWYEKHRSEFDAVYTRAGVSPTSPVDSYKGEIRLEDFEAIFAKGGKIYWFMMEPYLTKLFPGKRGTGRYTPEQEATWTTITAALDANKNVAANTASDVSRGPASGVGHSGGESKAKGLAGGHLYTILGYKPDDPNAAGPKFVLVRNPWGQYGRDYQEVDEERALGGKQKTLKSTAIDKGSGEFWLELADLSKRFNYIHVG